MDNNPKMVQLLLTMKANANVKLPNCLTPLLIALEKGSEEICLLLLKVPGIDVNTSMPSGDTPLHLAIRIGLSEVAKMMIPLFIDFEKARTKSKGYNPLHEAASQGNVAIIEAILKTNRVSVDSKTDSGDTALHIASELNFVESVQKLLLFKANVNE